MDIRNFFKKPKSVIDSKRVDNFTEGESDIESTQFSEVSAEKKINEKEENCSDINNFDIGHFLNETLSVSDEIRYKFLTEPWIPMESYDFKKDSLTSRSFRQQWLNQYPCISYSAAKKGAFCRLCVLFRPSVHRGMQGAFIIKEYNKYKNFHEDIKKHMNSAWHKEAALHANDFKLVMEHKKKNVAEQMDSALNKLIQSNREKMIPIIKSIVFCGQHGLSLRGKTDEKSTFQGLLEFRIDSGDKILKDHLEGSSKNARYVSHRIQNEIINICGNVLRNRIVKDLNDSEFFSIIADESVDIAGIEQLSLAARFVQENDGKLIIREEFLGFAELEGMDAATVSSKIISKFQEFGLDLTKTVGQAYDGCSVMAGKISGVHKRIQDKYPAANFFPCSSHKLNLVVNDLNAVPEIRNTIGCIKEVINYFRESPLRRREAPRIPLLCETRWTEKYKSIRLFKDNFLQIMNALQHLSTEGTNSQTRQQASQLYSSCTTSTFLVCLTIIAEYSAILEPVANVLQGVDQNLLSIKKQIDILINIFEKDRDCEKSEKFDVIMKEVLNKAENLEVEIKVPRLSCRQKNRTNVPHNSTHTYYQRAVFIPYLDSLITSLKERFSKDNEAAFSLFRLIPKYMVYVTKQDYSCIIKKITEKYGCFLENFSAEAQIWYAVWEKKPKHEISNFNIFDDLNNHSLFYPSIYKALKIALSLPTTTCTVERSFSTLRRVKTWIRSTMKEDRLNSLCMMHVHRDIIKDMGNIFHDQVLEEFSRNPRRLQFVFIEE